MKNFLLLGILLVAMGFSGCAVKQQILIDGQPVPDFVYEQRHVLSGIITEGFVARIILEEDEESGEDFFRIADYLRIGTEDIQYLEKDTFAIQGMVQVYNPKKVTYSLFVIYEINNSKEELRSFSVSSTLYQGDALMETHIIQRRIEKENPEIILRIMIVGGKIDKIYDLKREEILIEFVTGFVVKKLAGILPSQP